MQLAMKQDGFRATYGSPILDSTWVYFGARFDSEEQMNAWHGEPQHRVIQKSAPNWWTALYLRKWRAPMPGEVLGDRLMSETSILVDTALDDSQIKSMRQALAELGDAGAQPFETLTGEFEAQPFQFTGPVQIAPAAEKVLYLLVAHWSSADRLMHGNPAVRIVHCKTWATCRANSSCQSSKRGRASTCGTTSCSGIGNGRLRIVARR